MNRRAEHVRKAELWLIRAALVTLKVPLWIASVATWRLEAWRSRLQTALDSRRTESKPNKPERNKMELMKAIDENWMSVMGVAYGLLVIVLVSEWLESRRRKAKKTAADKKKDGQK
jgi:hypothetical protein